ncbi:MAG TPA: cytidine deaminase [Kiritimatiellia bacterium]|nr:cytidine deaminase [Kiritimatiellia bacterium]HRU69866.1 cytidine deaminase [Kiritimatiellia bacterium]
MTLDAQMRRKLIAAAREAAARAYCPYSNYPVGAALLTRDGRIVTGCNIENVSFGLTLCAERVALVKAVSEGLCGFAALAVVGGEQTAAAPCGACRQMLAEFCTPEMPVYYARLTGGRCVATTLDALLPRAFLKN